MCLTVALLTACTPREQAVRQERLLTDWQFTQLDSADQPTGEGWHNVRIPHDWAISGDFDRNNDLQKVIVVQNGENEATWKTGRSGGLPWMGKGHYRTRIKVDTTRWNTLVFDGAMSHADVYINGEEVCYWPYGYNTFDCYILPQLLNGDSVDIDVFLENKPQQSRWYPGAGLYRNVHLISTNRIHVPTFGTLVRTPEVSPERATVTIAIELQDGVDPTTEEKAGVELVTDILFNGKVVATITGQEGCAEIQDPQLWSPETPNLYTARTRVYLSNIKHQTSNNKHQTSNIKHQTLLTKSIPASAYAVSVLRPSTASNSTDRRVSSRACATTTTSVRSAPLSTRTHCVTRSRCCRIWAAMRSAPATICPRPNSSNSATRWV